MKRLKAVGIARKSVLVLLLGFCCIFHGQQPATDKVKQDTNKKMDWLMVYGKGFLFSAKEPDGWHGDTEETARYFQANLVFVPEDPRSRAAHVTIRIRVNHKETT